MSSRRGLQLGPMFAQFRRALSAGGDVRDINDLTGLLSAAAMAVIASVIVAALYFGADVLVPLALSILLSFVLAPAVQMLHKRRIPRALAVTGIVLLAFGVIFLLGSIIASQVTQLAENLPRYQLTMQQKIQSLRGATGESSTLERAANVLKNLGTELDRPAVSGPPTQSGSQDRSPIQVEVREPTSPLAEVAALIRPLVHPLTTTGLIIIFVVFILLQREDLRNRMIRLAGSHDLQRTTAAMDDAAHRLSRLLVTQLALNAGFGVVVGLGLLLVGIPNYLLWGILAAILRFVPYIGPIIAAVFPLAVAAAVDPGWTMLVWTIGLFLVTETLAGQVFEPLLYGRSSGLSPVAVIVSAAFWTALWGPIGLVLATPLTVCLVVLGRHVEQLEFLDVMLGNRPALSPPELFYQRMLAGDPIEAVEKAEEFLKECSLLAFYDEVALKGLALAQIDLSRGALDEDRLMRVRETVGEVVQELGERDEANPKEGTAAAAETVPEIASGRPSQPPDAKLAPDQRKEVLCIAGRNILDEASALILAQFLGREGIAARVESSDAHSGGNLFRLDSGATAAACICYLDATSPGHMRYTVRRLRRRMPAVPIMLVCWSMTAGELATGPFRETVRADLIAVGLKEAVDAIVGELRGGKSDDTPHAAASLVQGAA
jgi:predicted PurR-regulated permease PerM